MVINLDKKIRNLQTLTAEEFKIHPKIDSFIEETTLKLKFDEMFETCQ